MHLSRHIRICIINVFAPDRNIRSCGTHVFAPVRVMDTSEFEIQMFTGALEFAVQMHLQLYGFGYVRI